jgi:hypothetical protein
MKYREVPRIKSETSTFTLSRDAKAKWLKALRSGRYKQGRGTLYCGNTKSFCCLGVLCVTQGVKLSDIEGEDFPLGFGLRESPDSWRVSTGGYMPTLSALNDEKELTFAQIADLIEAQVPCHD